MVCVIWVITQLKRVKMADRKDLKVGDKVKHRFRENKYQRCTILEVEEGCNGGVRVICEDGFYGERERKAHFAHKT